jgi:signal transduction histidine kinase
VIISTRPTAHSAIRRFYHSKSAVTLPSRSVDPYIQQQTKQEDNLALQVVLTTVFYAGILLCVFVWLYPLIKRLRLLRSTAKSFGEGDFSEPIHISSTSYIVEIENEFNRMAEKIETLVEDNKLLSNAASQDLRTPLARLRFGIEALNETNNQENQEKYIRHLSQDIQEMENLVGILLNYARLEQKMIKVEPLTQCLNTLIKSAVHTLISRDSNTISIDIIGLCKSQISIDGDENHLSMLINNLLSNAQQYAVKQVRITTEQTNNSVIMCVCDDGQGITLEKRENIFKPFTRGESYSQHKGYGMGLAIVARIAVWHKAQVTISESKTLGGAKFEVKFNSSS